MTDIDRLIDLIVLYYHKYDKQRPVYLNFNDCQIIFRARIDEADAPVFFFPYAMSTFL